MRSFGVAVLLVAVGLGLGAVPAAADAVADHRAFVLAGFSGTTDEDYRAWTEQVQATAPTGSSTYQAATAALAGTDEDIRAYVDGGYLAAFHLDERYRLLQVVAWAETPFIDRAVQAAAESSDPAVWSEFLTNGLPRAQYADDRLSAARILDVITPESSPVLWEATQVALAGSAAELREFIASGQFVARDLDAQAAQPPVVPAVPAVPAAPAPAAPAPAAPAPAAPAVTAPRGTQRPVVLAATGVAEGPIAALAAAALLAGAGLVLVARRRRRTA
ncbi:LPXTG cell wall anchor domain-containing protein [Cellulomonas sp. Sa3CUA2]|uniref:LPXTG cell wall anchor domain-containing protein n=1 Tax=Cellulomonas avistercoris TaxID=2762242 RepID=A0ABR8QEF2_9CELL|nr:ALF repeat-containing protein [Cellulomonas avistercoris]MBD7918814.1 LPXTG cell wall anchor domain-containing protein [Cellulomonas avistercoris]